MVFMRGQDGQSLPGAGKYEACGVVLPEVRKKRGCGGKAVKGRKAINSTMGTRMYSDYKTTEWLLQQWGLWARLNPHPNHDYPHIEPFERMRSPSGIGCAITDEEGEDIDAIISELHEDSKDQQKMLHLYYRHGLTVRGISKYTGKSIGQIHGLLDSARSWFKGRCRGVRTLKTNILHSSN